MIIKYTMLIRRSSSSIKQSRREIGKEMASMKRKEVLGIVAERILFLSDAVRDCRLHRVIN